MYRVRIVWWTDDDALMLDLLLLTPELQEIWDTRQVVHWEHGEIPIVSPEGMIELKMK